jgi:hypothetical protein
LKKRKNKKKVQDPPGKYQPFDFCVARMPIISLQQQEEGDDAEAPCHELQTPCVFCHIAEKAWQQQKKQDGNPGISRFRISHVCISIGVYFSYYLIVMVFW